MMLLQLRLKRGPYKRTYNNIMNKTEKKKHTTTSQEFPIPNKKLAMKGLFYLG